MAEQLKGKFIITVNGDVKPLFATSEQWYEISTKFKDGAVPIVTNEGEQEVFAILEVAKGYTGKDLASSADGILMIFSKED
ncbi:hypothetical protein [Solibacillus sp. CAU 1738]|uniref:hypothetical protein n=1 Tax=Solibacillus sp. CAU 1738 TaxID=3140363 RepID=UPI00326012C2